MNSPKPALVTQRGARRLPRLALWLLCAAYVLPGLVGRDPWRNADVNAFGLMAAMAEGRTSWWAPTLGGVPADTALVSHWLGAAFIAAGSGWLNSSCSYTMAWHAVCAAWMLKMKSPPGWPIS